MKKDNGLTVRITALLVVQLVVAADFETGRLLDALEELGLSENTLVIYTSDNGPWNQDKYTKNKKGHPPGSIFWGQAGPLRRRLGRQSHRDRDPAGGDERPR